MDLGDAPESLPISSQTIVIKPENQGDINKSNGSRNIRMFLPDYVGYFQPSLSNFHFQLRMAGRGQAIPSRDAGWHSLFSTIRTHDGSGSALLESVEQYNTLVAQTFLYTRSEGADNQRAEYEGVNQNKTCDNNLFWAQSGGLNWSAGLVTKPSVARPVQCLAPIHTTLYDTDKYIPCDALGGMRMELQLENYQRALEYTCAELGVGPSEGVMAYPLIMNLGSGQPAVGAPVEPAVPTFIYTTAGTAFNQGNIYSFTTGSGGTGFIEAITTTPAVAGTLDEASIYCLGLSGATATTSIPVEGTVLTVLSPGGTNAVLQVNVGVSAIGDGKTANSYQQIHIPLWASTGAVSSALASKAVALGGAGSVVSPLDLATSEFHMGDGSLRYPYRACTPKASTAYNNDGCFPGSVMPFDIGDKVYVAGLDDTPASVVSFGIVQGLEEYIPSAGGTNCPRLRCVNDRPNQTTAGAPLVTDTAVPTLIVGANVFGANVYGFTHLLKGYKVYVKSSERLNAYTIQNLPTGGVMDILFTQASNVVDYTISDFQYQIHQLNMPESTLNSDKEASLSERGLQIDLDTVECRQVNMASIQGPTSQLISIPNITRALGVLSVPLAQTEQRGLEYQSLRGISDQMTTYQYELGQKGLVPNRPVPVQMASLNNPKIQTQETNEKMKVMDAFGVSVVNLNQVGMNFAVGRQFSRPGMYMDLMEAGDLILKAQFDNPQTSTKLYCHFINHLRSINISRNGFRIAN